MLEIPYSAMLIVISAIWLLVRAIVWIKEKRFYWKRELLLLLVYVCIVVVVRFSFCPMAKVNGKLQPLVFDAAKAWPFRINLVPFVNLLDYTSRRELILNIVGNSTMYIPLGVVWPIVYKKLDKPWKVLVAGVGFSLCVEVLQLPFYDRVTDIDDLLLNFIGFLAGYGLYLLVRTIIRKTSKK